MGLATRFSKRNAISHYSHEAIGESQLMQLVPSVFANGAHESRSERYSYIPTIDVLRGLAREGFLPFFACQAKSRIEGKSEFTKHMLRLRHPDHMARKDSVNEVILINSHDGTSSYQMLAGNFRAVCTNGCVWGDVSDDIRIRHGGHVLEDVVAGAYHVLETFGKVDASRDSFESLQLTDGEQRVFGEAALALRFGTDELPPVNVTQVLQPRRYEDRGDSLWTTFQRVQENLVRGGLRTSERKRRGVTRAVNGIDGNVALNRGLWVLAERMRELRAA